MVLTSNKWSNLFIKVCLKIGEEVAEDSEWGKKKEVEDEHLTRSWSWDSIVKVMGGN